jgi:hypothetical protein
MTHLRCGHHELITTGYGAIRRCCAASIFRDVAAKSGRPLKVVPDETLRIVARGEKTDGGET